MKMLEKLHRITHLKEKMWERLKQINIKVEFSSYEKIHDMYLDRFGKDDIIKEYDMVNQFLSDCPVMID